MKLFCNLAFVLVAFAIFIISNVSAAIQSSDSQRDFNDNSDWEARLLARLELADLARILRAAQISPFGNSFGGTSMMKRKSELINSLLPKNAPWRLVPAAEE